MSLFTLGLFEKTAVADALMAPIAEKVFAATTHVTSVDAWAGSLAFSAQIFCDFAGYSTCAIGAAMCLGFAIPDNFRYPYAAIGFQDFWRRWHISLSSWLRDYLYISLGGNRSGRGRTLVNLMITMLLGGLWHGASWTFVVWGGLHGAYLVLERLLQRWFGALAVWRRWPMQVLLALGTYVGVVVAWVFFRAQDFAAARLLLSKMFLLGAGPASQIVRTNERAMVLGVTVLILVLHWLMLGTTLEAVADRTPWWLRSAVLAGMLVAVVTMSGDDRAFIYFQF